MSPLTPAFAHGWNKLHTELKVHILNFNTRGLADKFAVSYQEQIKLMVLKYSLALPEFGALVQDAIYRHNTFFIAWRPGKRIYLPPFRFRRLITRHVVFSD